MGIEKIEEAMDFVNNRRSGNGLATPSITYSTLADLVHSSHNSQPNPSIHWQIVVHLILHGTIHLTKIMHRFL